MKKHLKISVMAVAAVFLVIGTASATPIGIKNYAGAVPDVQYDSGGQVTYTDINDLFEIQAWDKNLWLEKPGPGIAIANNVGFGLAVYVDNNGDLTEGVTNHTYTWGSESVTTDYDMIEYVLNNFSFDWKGSTYSFNKGDTFLAADVKAFGWQDSVASSFDYFDYLFDTVSGKMVTFGLWPTSPLTGGYIDTSQWTVGSNDWNPWQGDLTVLTEKGDKYPVPEPATVLLMGAGLGLLGLGAACRKKLGKKDA
ncbi:MAG: PEP-CTERM sorting domain-containing protein [Dissulfuribacterales bacterium]